MKLKLYQGDILDLPVDVLICSANVSLNLSGGVGGALLARFGKDVQEELHRHLPRQAPRFARPGDVKSARIEEVLFVDRKRSLPMCIMSYEKTLFCSMVIFGLVLASVWAEGTNQSLFVIERSKNANVVRYDANLTADGVLDPKEPVKVYWVLLAEDGRHEKLSSVGLKGYGLDIKRDSSGKAWVMTLAAYRKREIIVRQTGAVVRAEIVIDGKPSILEKVYINSTEGRFWLTVNYVELFGKDLETGEKRHEKLLPE